MLRYLCGFYWWTMRNAPSRFQARRRPPLLKLCVPSRQSSRSDFLVVIATQAFCREYPRAENVSASSADNFASDAFGFNLTKRPFSGIGAKKLLLWTTNREMKTRNLSFALRLFGFTSHRPDTGEPTFALSLIPVNALLFRLHSITWNGLTESGQP